jgi:hypothetical protein
MRRPSMRADLRIKVGLAAVAAAVVGALMMVPVVAVLLDHVGPGGRPEPVDLLNLSWLLFVLPPALVAGALSAGAASLLLNPKRSRAYVTGALIPPMALAIWWVATFVVWPAALAGRAPGADAAFILVLYAIPLSAWVICPMGLIGTWAIRRLWFEAPDSTLVAAESAAS